MTAEFKKLRFMFIVGLLLSGCSFSAPQVPHHSPHVDPPVIDTSPPLPCPEKDERHETLKALLHLKKDALKSELLNLEYQLSHPEKRVLGPELYFHLALLYSSPNNPLADYGNALNQIKRYMQFAAKDQITDIEQYILKLLTRIESQRYKRKTCNNQKQVLLKENQALKTKLKNAADETRRLKKAIQALEQLDIRLEKKRTH
ncbi:MAG: hypothetical protein CSA29_01755 [Desulfobacterales bacterium]|nr:MAG: hypothetical protein CSA29_01755 [Desulfobacterales bacterium]